MLRYTSLATLAFLALVGAGCGTDRQPRTCGNDNDCPADATCDNQLCTALPAGECRLPAACSPPANSTATCDSLHQCGYTCNDHFNRCSGACVADSPDACGTNCTQCPVPASGSAACVDGQCGIACPTDQHACGQSCVPETADSCGPSCTQCPRPPNGSAACVAEGCAISCDNTFHPCMFPGGGGTCVSTQTDCKNVCPSDQVACATGCCPRAVGISSGVAHTCVVTTGGTATCWGSNSAGQLGRTGTTSGPGPVVDSLGTPIAGLVSIGAGWDFTCGLTAAETVKCWGGNSFGQLGASASSTSPVDVLDSNGSVLANVSMLSVGGQFACAIVGTSHIVKCWGANNWGQLGLKSVTATPQSAAADVCADVTCLSALNGATAIAAGYSHACIVTASSSVLCWGSNVSKELGCSSQNPSCTSQYSTVPVSVINGATGVLGSVTSLSAGQNFSCAMTNSSGTGAVKCWGRDFDGELGNGVQLPGADTNVPTPVLLPNQVTSVACGTRSSCALENSGTARCWGWDRDGGLGDGMLTDSSTPLQVQDSGAPMSGISQVSSGGRFACALLSYGGVKCWGLNDAKQLGGKALGTYSYTPVDVPLY